MVLESTMICVDNSDYMRNGDFIPTRLQAQQEAVNLVCHSKTRSNPENNVGLLTLSNSVDVLATLTSDVGRIMSKLHAVTPKGEINFLTGIRIAQLALKHRQGKNHKMRIVVFIGSPISVDEKELTKVAKKLKKEKVNVDIVSFGEEAANNETLTTFIQILNGKDSNSSQGAPSSTSGSHLVTVPPGPHLADALISSPIIQGEDGAGPSGLGAAGFEFGVDPNEDPELALALRVSMEEQRQRQEEEARRGGAGSSAVGEGRDGTETSGTIATTDDGNEEALLERALAMSMETDEAQSDSGATCGSSVVPDFSAMTEEEQIIYAMQMSMQDNNEANKGHGSEAGAMEVETEGEPEGDLMHDREFIESVLETLPGVDPNDPYVTQLLASITSDSNTRSETDPEKAEEKKNKKDSKK